MSPSRRKRSAVAFARASSRCYRASGPDGYARPIRRFDSPTTAADRSSSAHTATTTSRDSSRRTTISIPACAHRAFRRSEREPSEWLEGLAEGVNAVAIVDDRPIGQVSFVPDGTGRHELAIFVHQDYQRAGIGSELLAVGMGHAAQQGVEYVWLSVERNKGHLLRLYSRAGFSAVNPLGFTPRMSRYL